MLSRLQLIIYQYSHNEFYFQHYTYVYIDKYSSQLSVKLSICKSQNALLKCINT